MERKRKVCCFPCCCHCFVAFVSASQVFTQERKSHFINHNSHSLPISYGNLIVCEQELSLKLSQTCLPYIEKLIFPGSCSFFFFVGTKFSVRWKVEELVPFCVRLEYFNKQFLFSFSSLYFGIESLERKLQEECKKE